MKLWISWLMSKDRRERNEDGRMYTVLGYLFMEDNMMMIFHFLFRLKSKLCSLPWCSIVEHSLLPIYIQIVDLFPRCFFLRLVRLRRGVSSTLRCCLSSERHARHRESGQWRNWDQKGRLMYQKNGIFSICWLYRLSRWPRKVITLGQRQLINFELFQTP